MRELALSFDDVVQYRDWETAEPLVTGRLFDIWAGLSVLRGYSLSIYFLGKIDALEVISGLHWFLDGRFSGRSL